MTGARGLKIANIDKLYIFDMQLFMFLYRGIFFDAALLGVLHCYIVTFVFSGRRGNSPWIAPAPLTKYLSTTEHEERQVTDSMHLCPQPLYL